MPRIPDETEAGVKRLVAVKEYYGLKNAMETYRLCVSMVYHQISEAEAAAPEAERETPK